MRIFPVQSNFTAGEITPKLYGRSDIDRYHNAAKVLENVIIKVQGGVERRPGQRYLAKAKHENKFAALIPYVFNRQQAYMLEVGDAYLRIFLSDGSQVMDGALPYEIQTDYAEADLSAIDYVQNADTMFLFHESYPTRRLRRFGLTNWVLEDIPWVVEPFDEIGFWPGAAATLSDATVGTGRTLTAATATFLAADVGREVRYSGGVATITAITSATVATVDVGTPFPNVALSAGDWLLADSPLTTLTPTYPGASASTDLPPVGASVTLTLSAAGWRTADVGKWVDLNSGLVQITAVTSATIATATVYQQLSALVAVPALAWLLKSSVWGGHNGYPRTGTFFEQRLWLGGSNGYPQTVWGSRIGEYLNFELGTDDDDAVSFTLASDQQNQILHLTQIKRLVALTNGGEFTLQGSLDKSITPTNVQIQNQSAYGSSAIQPERIGNELMFVQRAGRKIRAFAAGQIDTDTYSAPELTVLADHMTQGGIQGSAYQGEPDSLLHCVRVDGQLASCTVDRDQEVVGWARQITAGTYISVATLPTDGGDELWAIVERTIGGVRHRYVERFDATLMTDCAITATSEAGDTTWLGLDHLEGATVTVKADGVKLVDRVVSGGQITIERPARAIEIGLAYTPRIVMLRPEAMGATGTIQSSNVRVSQVVVRFLESCGCFVNGQPVFARKTGLGVLDQPPPTMTGDERIETLGWDIGDFALEITQPDPYPFHVQSVITTLTVNQ